MIWKWMKIIFISRSSILRIKFYSRRKILSILNGLRPIQPVWHVRKICSGKLLPAFYLWNNRCLYLARVQFLGPAEPASNARVQTIRHCIGRRNQELIDFSTGETVAFFLWEKIMLGRKSGRIGFKNIFFIQILSQYCRWNRRSRKWQSNMSF